MEQDFEQRQEPYLDLALGARVRHDHSNVANAPDDDPRKKLIIWNPPSRLLGTGSAENRVGRTQP